MQQPLPYLYFVLGVLLALLCFAALLCLSYRKSGKLRDMVRFVLSPREYGELDLRTASILKSFLWFLAIHLSLTFLYHFTDVLIHAGDAAGNSVGQAARSLPLWVVLLLPPLLEETAFRLPLRRRRTYLTVAAAALMFFVSAPLFSTRVYDVTWPRILSCASVALIVWFGGYGWIQRLGFRSWFWGLVLLFALLHVINYELGAMDAGEWLRVLLKEAVKIPSALMFAYVRLRHGFTLSVVLHFIVNLSAFLLGAMA
ncbi:hypothetical protein [Alistipes sp. Marseille-P5061]|uniref:hypothetical protein n=1 Tax=Alistipes sp. Marseille-P5061 TaxID=2048242 RepID=UPI0032098421